MKIFSTILIILIIIGVGFGAYWYFSKEDGGGSPLSNINIGDFFPFGKAPEEETPVTPSEETPTTPTEESPVQQGTGGGNLVLPKLFKLSNAEQAGATIFASSTETVVRYIDRQTGNVYEYNLTHPEKGRVRITNTTIPKIHSATWFEKGNSVLLSYLDERSGLSQTVYGSVVPGNASSSDGVMYKALQTTFVGNSITPVANPSLQKIAYVDGANGNNSIIIANKNGGSTKIIAPLATKEWNLSWPAESSIIATTKANDETLGYAYSINTSSGALRKILGDMKGLVVLPNKNLEKFLYSEVISNTPLLSVYTKSTNVKDSATVKTFASKCAWGKEVAYCGVPKTLPSGDYPDSWYMGSISFDDSLWSFNPTTGLAKQILNPDTATNDAIDMTNIVVDPNEKYILFTNKVDSALWVYTI